MESQVPDPQVLGNACEPGLRADWQDMLTVWVVEE